MVSSLDTVRFCSPDFTKALDSHTPFPSFATIFDQSDASKGIYPVRQSHYTEQIFKIEAIKSVYLVDAWITTRTEKWTISMSKQIAVPESNRETRSNLVDFPKARGGGAVASNGPMGDMLLCKEDGWA